MTIHLSDALIVGGVVGTFYLAMGLGRWMTRRQVSRWMSDAQARQMYIELDHHAEASPTAQPWEVTVGKIVEAKWRE